MLRLTGIVISIGLADSLNPSTIGPALFLASGERARGRVIEFTLAVFSIYFVGGAAVGVGAGQLLRPLLPHPRHHIADIIETAVGAAMLGVGVLLLRYRRPLAKRDAPDFNPHGRSSLFLGASITALELPTAFPYFAAIAAIVGSDLGPVRDLVLLLLFNACFVLPLVAIVVTLSMGSDTADRVLSRSRAYLEDHWPTVLATLAILAGAFVLLLGVTGLTASRARFLRHLHHVLHP
jgi:cytochrome c biogenesis protein CcdA